MDGAHKYNGIKCIEIFFIKMLNFFGKSLNLLGNAVTNSALGARTIFVKALLNPNAEDAAAVKARHDDAPLFSSAGETVCERFVVCRV